MQHFTGIIESSIVKEKCPNRWVSVLYGLGSTYMYKQGTEGSAGRITDNGIEKAIECFTRYLEVSNEE